MYVKKILLSNYRNLEDLNIELSQGINIFYGDNAQGKTNLLESVYYCSAGRSHRTHIDRELIKFGEMEAHIKTFVQKENYVERIDVHLKKDEKKGIAINGIPIKKIGQIFGTLITVIFSPEDLNIIKSGPSERRKFMDLEICQLKPSYYYELQQYYSVLKQRNVLLKNVQKNKEAKDTIFLWDEQLVRYGTKIMAERQQFIEKLNTIAIEKHNELTGNTENLTIEYKQNISCEFFLDKLKRNIDKDIIFGSTSVGPHKDDINFYINHCDVKIFGSQGQQRSVALTLKLSEIQLIFQEKNEFPVLLLDDVLSELDLNRQKYLLLNIKNLQTILTCTGVEDVIKKNIADATVFPIQNGKINL